MTPPTQNRRESQVSRAHEPPDCWDAEFPDGSTSLDAVVQKPWRGAATFIRKVPVSNKKTSVSGKGGVDDGLQKVE